MNTVTRKKILLLDMDDVTVDQTRTWIKRIYEKQAFDINGRISVDGICQRYFRKKLPR